MAYYIFYDEFCKVIIEYSGYYEQSCLSVRCQCAILPTL
jgi:hypothetical protein